MTKHYVIGDVHGMLEPLQSLLQNLPADANIIFAGDLIDRGNHSAEVVKLVREQGYACVLGNHENTFIAFFEDYFGGMSYRETVNKWSMWLLANGGKETLESYSFWENPAPNAAVINRIKDDVTWMKRLPIYIELDTNHQSGLPVVVSHSNITHVWHLRHFPDCYDQFKDVATRTRDLTYDPKSGIINIFGHTPTQKHSFDNFCINVDTGCCYEQEGLGILSAYCIEENHFVSS